MARSRFTGPIYTSKGFRFSVPNYGDKSMTIIGTTVIQASAASSSMYSCTLTNASLGGLDKIENGWVNVRQRTAATCIFATAVRMGAGNSLAVTLIGNIGTGQKFGGRACTLDIFAQGYCS